MKSEEDYYARRMKKADAIFPYIMWAGLAFILVFTATKLFSHL